MESAIKNHISILFYDPKHANRQRAHMILGASGAKVDCPCDLSELIEFADKKPYSLLFLDIEGHRFLSEQGKDLSLLPTVVLSDEKLGQVHPYLSQVKNFTNFIAKTKDGDLQGRDLYATMQKTVNWDIFGVHKYLNWGANSMIFHVRDSHLRGDYVDAVLNYCRNMALDDRTLRSVRIFCEELLMNALFDAPRTEDGKARYATQSRSEQVLLDPTEAARLEVACDGERLAISVSDPFGAIDRDIVLTYLTKCFTDASPRDAGDENKGAGLGLFFCFNAVSHFVINVNPMIKSEFVGIIDISKSIKERKRAHPSFHYFSTNHKVPQFMIGSKPSKKK